MLSAHMADLSDEATRYPYRRIAEEIERVLDERPRGTKKRCAQAAGLSADGLRNRITGRTGYRFSIDGERWDTWRKLVKEVNGVPTK